MADETANDVANTSGSNAILDMDEVRKTLENASVEIPKEIVAADSVIITTSRIQITDKVFFIYSIIPFDI